jgi:peptide/nickel transport system ATP-binding protein
VPALSVKDLSVEYGAGREARRVVSDVDLEIEEGCILGLVGESGSGKSTVARAILGLVRPVAGTVAVGGVDLLSLPFRRRAPLVQMVFQDPYSSLNPRLSVGSIIAEALPRGIEAKRRQERIVGLLDLVALDSELAERVPRQLSGGQRQRVAIARALAAGPRLLVADEITSALDVSVQAQVLNVVKEVQRRERLTVLFISHSLAVVRYVSDRIAVMHSGSIVESGTTDEIIGAPSHPYTRALLASVLGLAGTAVEDSTWLPISGPQHAGRAGKGCAYRNRCPVGPAVRPERRQCDEEDPLADAPRREHNSACHFSPLRASVETKLAPS